jgi:hypothetical protein
MGFATGYLLFPVRPGHCVMPEATKFTVAHELERGL